jgi:hypothetical protein
MFLLKQTEIMGTVHGKWETPIANDELDSDAWMIYPEEPSSAILEFLNKIKF